MPNTLHLQMFSWYSSVPKVITFIYVIKHFYKISLPLHISLSVLSFYFIRSILHVSPGVVR